MHPKSSAATRRRPAVPPGCARCGARRASAFSYRLGCRVCWACYHRTFDEPAAAESARIALQRRIADAIRRAIEPLPDGARRTKLRARALLIEVADEAAEVKALIAEARRLGVEVGRR